jgi:hypothetical protein
LQRLQGINILKSKYPLLFKPPRDKKPDFGQNKVPDSQGPPYLGLLDPGRKALGLLDPTKLIYTQENTPYSVLGQHSIV